MAEIGTDLQKTAAILKSGGLVAIPTETVYGLAANALNPDAVAKIFEAKNRPFFDPLIVHISSIPDLEKYAREIPNVAIEFCSRIWPGPLTAVLKKREIIPEIVTAGNDSVGLRIPRNPLTLALLKMLPFPLAAPSANPFGYISPTSAKHVNDQLGEKIDYILDGGSSEVGVESTIVRFTDAIPEVLRWGGIAPETLRNFLGAYRENLHQNSDPTAPGQLDKHYSPHTKIILIESDAAIPEIALSEKTALLRFQFLAEKFRPEDQFVLAPDGTTSTAAVNLFRMLREIDEKEYLLIIAEKVPDNGLGRAINDRLTRAARQ